MRNEKAIHELSWKHYNEWMALDNLDDESPLIWLYGSFATVRGLIRIPFNDGRIDLGRKLLAILYRDLEEFESSLPPGALAPRATGPVLRAVDFAGSDKTAKTETLKQAQTR